MTRILVSAALANHPNNGGMVWEKMSWAVGLRRLGFDVWFVEEISESGCVGGDGRPATLGASENLRWFTRVTEAFGFRHQAFLVSDGDTSGAERDRLAEIAQSAELLVNISGHLRLPEVLDAVGCRVYVDMDPGITQ